MENVDVEQRNIVEGLDLTYRNIFKIQKQPATLTLKDHKENFDSSPSTRLINPTKPEIGKISKKILDRVIPEIRRITNFNQWKNSDSIISWFKKIPDNNANTFILFNVANMYGSINMNFNITMGSWNGAGMKLNIGAYIRTWTIGWLSLRSQRG